MAVEKDIICLANSIKQYPCRCVAGVDIETGEWVRPVSEKDLGELERGHFITADGHNPVPLDIIRIYLEGPTPEESQPENWKLADQDWELIPGMTASEQFEILNSVLESGPELLGNQERAIQSGNEVDASLALIKPENPSLRRKSRHNKKDQPRIKFELGGVNYNLPITDPIWKGKVLELVDSSDRSSLNNHLESDCIPLLTVSLGSEYRGEHWKLAAGIIEVPEKYF